MQMIVSWKGIFRTFCTYEELHVQHCGTVLEFFRLNRNGASHFSILKYYLLEYECENCIFQFYITECIYELQNLLWNNFPFLPVTAVGEIL